MSEPFLSSDWHRIAELRPRLKVQVRVHRHRYRRQVWYVADDPTSGRHHRFSAAVYRVVGLMDGERRVDAIWTAAVEDLGDDAPSQGDVERLLAQLHAADLLQMDVPPDAEDLFRRRERQGRAVWRQRFLSPLSLKLPLLDPDRALAATAPLVRPLFSLLGFAAWLVLIVCGAAVAVSHWEPLGHGLAEEVLAPENLIALALIYPVVKAVHELGHAYAAKLSGGAVHEMGLMFLVFMPVPYVDVSSAIALRSKWRRALIGAAGMMAETALASLCLLVWAAAEPGSVRTIAYNVVLIAGVSTLAVNLNPLVRFDGYYILCDLIEFPNLAQRANRWWLDVIHAYGFGLPRQAPPSDVSEQVWMALYSPLSLAYRMVLLFGISVFVASTYLAVGFALALLGILGGIVWPLLRGLWLVMTASRFAPRRARAVSVTAGAIGAVAVVLFAVPLPMRAQSEGVIWLGEDHIVRADGSGFVSRIEAESGSAVARAAPLLAMVDPQLDAEIRQLEARIVGLEAKLVQQDFADRVAAGISRDELAINRAALAQRLNRRNDLVVRAPAAGRLSLLLEDRLAGRFVKRGEIVGYVTDPAPRIVRALVSQGEIDLLRQRLVGIEVMAPGRLGGAYPARLVREVPEASRQLPSPVLTTSGGGRLAVDPSDKNALSAMARQFQIDVAVPAGAVPPVYGSRVYLRFDFGPEPFGSQLWRRLRQLAIEQFNV